MEWGIGWTVVFDQVGLMELVRGWFPQSLLASKIKQHLQLATFVGSAAVLEPVVNLLAIMVRVLS